MEDSVVLVTGGSGFLGQHVVKHLQILANHVKEIRVLDIVDYEQKLDFEQRTHVKSFVGSITDTHVVNRACEGMNVVNRACEGVNVVNRACEGVNVVNRACEGVNVVNRACEGVNVVNRACEGVNVVNRACEGVNVVMHIASVIDWRMFPNYKALEEVNVTGTETVLNACKEQNVQHLIYCSSLSVYYGPEEVIRGTETSVKPPSKLYFNAYASTKVAAQKMVLDSDGFQLNNGKILRTITILPAAMFGELDRHTITESIRPFKGKTYFLPGPVKAILHYSYAGNTAVMFVKAMEALQVNPDLGGEMFFAVDDTPPDTLLAIIKPFFDQCNVKLSSWHMPYWVVMFLICVGCILRLVYHPFC